MASYRGFNLIMSQCYSERTMRELALSYGVYSSFQERRKSMDEFIHIALKNLVKTHNLKGDDLIVVLAGNYNAGSGFSFMLTRFRYCTVLPDKWESWTCVIIACQNDNEVISFKVVSFFNRFSKRYEWTHPLIFVSPGNLNRHHMTEPVHASSFRITCELSGWIPGRMPIIPNGLPPVVSA